VAFGNETYEVNLVNWDYKYDSYAKNLVNISFGGCLCNCQFCHRLVPWRSLLGHLGVH
jgi:hypothetical protein